MRTMAVYVVVSDDTDVYFEQAWVSAWSLKHYNPDMEVVCVVDPETYDNVIKGYRYKALNVIDRLVEVEVPKEYNKKFRSRWLKTSLREHVAGDFLFIDTDTIICGQLDEVDHLHGDVMMVLDNHCPLFDNIDSKYIRQGLKHYAAKEYTSDSYYNSGVIYCKDTNASHKFFQKWHEQWNRLLSAGNTTDQQPLAIANLEFPLIEELDGIYNCQIRLSIKYLYKAKIMHFFNNSSTTNVAHPFYLPQTYQALKKRNGITPEFQQKILDCKSLFEAKTFIIAGSSLDILRGYGWRWLKTIRFDYPHIYWAIEKTSRLLLILTLWIKKK